MTSERGRGLIVEDVASTRRLMKVALSSSGLQLDEAQDAEGAARALATARYDVVLLDIGLAGGVSGIDLLRDIRSRPELDATPVLLVSGNGDREEVVRDGFRAGADDVLPKPVVPEHLAQRVADARAARRAHVRRRPSSGSIRRAANLRASLLPSLPRVESGVAIAGFSYGSTTLPADTIDIVCDDEGRVSAILVSPTERGVAGALVATAARASLRASLEAGASLSIAMARLERALPPCGLGAVGVAIARANALATRVSLVNAGLPPALIQRPGESARRFVSSPAAGLADDAAHCVTTVDLPRGSVVTLRSRAHHAEGDADLWSSLVARHGASLARATSEQLRALVREAGGEREDATLVLLGIEGAPVSDGGEAPSNA